jgi:hypothetical protein
VIEVSAFQMLLLTVTSWLDQREREVLAYLIEENRVLRRQLGGRRLRLTDDDRRTLGARAYRLGRAALRARLPRSPPYWAPLLRVTPAMAAGVTGRLFDVMDLVNLLIEAESKAA